VVVGKPSVHDCPASGNRLIERREGSELPALVGLHVVEVVVDHDREWRHGESRLARQCARAIYHG
jgi:hypothetical protein